MTINGHNIDNYLLQDINIGFEYRSGKSGFVANGMHFQNILAKKSVLTITFRPLTLAEYQTIKNWFYSTDEYLCVDNTSGGTQTINCYRANDFTGTNVGDNIIKGVTIQLKEI